MTVDAGGVYGESLHYALIIFLSGSAFILFLYFWSKGRLDMDEEPKEQMMHHEGEDEWMTK